MTTTLAVWLHNLDPFAVRFWPDGPAALQGIRWYGLSYLLGFLAAWVVARQVARTERSPLNPAYAVDLIGTVGLGVLVGGRLGYVVFYQPSLLWDPPLLGILQVWRGGMASHGGMIGGVVACYLFARRHCLPTLHVTDIIAAAAPIGLGLGRIANFINGELYGRGPTDVPWAVKFPQEVADFTAEQWARVDAIMATLPPAIQRQARFDPIGVIEQQVQDGNQILIAALEPMLTPRHPSQIYEALLEGLVLLVVLWWGWRRPRRPGVVSGWFLVLYGVLRVAVEQFREPDAHVGYQALGMTRGQWLSVGLIVGGGLLIYVCARRHAPRLGGWRGVNPPSPSSPPPPPSSSPPSSSP